MKKYSSQQGFTLVEIAIVLVIIGLLLGGVLKGQEMIDNAKVKNIVNDVKAIQTATTAYVDRYKALPGDEPAAAMTGRGWAGTAVPTVANNGTWTITLAQTFTNGGDQAAVWRSLRASGLMTGDPAAPATAAGLMSHSGGGLIGITAGPAYGLPGPLACVSGLTTKQVAAMDLMIDGAGAANNTGTLRAATGAANPLIPVVAAPVATGYNETLATRWTACIPL